MLADALSGSCHFCAECWSINTNAASSFQMFTKRVASGGNASETPASNFGQRTDYTESSFHSFLQLLQAESRIYLVVRPRPLSSSSRFIINCHPIIRPYAFCYIVTETITSFQFSFIANPSLSAV